MLLVVAIILRLTAGVGWIAQKLKEENRTAQDICSRLVYVLLRMNCYAV
jgi:predicted permease